MSSGPLRILFVCTGNTCRSPLAEAVARDLTEWEVGSAGLAAQDGALVSAGALEIARENGLDLESFQSRQLTREILDEADLVLVMELAHRAGVLSLCPPADTKTFLLGEFANVSGPAAAIADPFGGDIDSYRRTFHKIAQLFRDGIPRMREWASQRADDHSEGDS